MELFIIITLAIAVFIGIVVHTHYKEINHLTDRLEVCQRNFLYMQEERDKFACLVHFGEEMTREQRDKIYVAKGKGWRVHAPSGWQVYKRGEQ